MLAIVLCLAEHHAHGEGPYTMARILIIDDNVPTRDILRQALARLYPFLIFENKTQGW